MLNSVKVYCLTAYLLYLCLTLKTKLMKTKIYLTVALYFILLSVGTVMINNGNYNGIYFICVALSLFVLTTTTKILTRF